MIKWMIKYQSYILSFSFILLDIILLYAILMYLPFPIYVGEYYPSYERLISDLDIKYNENFFMEHFSTFVKNYPGTN